MNVNLKMSLQKLQKNRRLHLQQLLQKEKKRKTTTPKEKTRKKKSKDSKRWLC